MLGDIDLIFGMRVYNHKLQIKFEIPFVILSLLLRELKKSETFASLLNIHGGVIHVVLTHLVLYYIVYYKIRNRVISRYQQILIRL